LNSKYSQKATKNNMKQRKAIIISVLAFATIFFVALSLWALHRMQLRTEMGSQFTQAISIAARQDFRDSLPHADEAKALAQRLGDDDYEKNIDALIRLVNTIILADDLFDSGDYQAAQDTYIIALEYSADLNTYFPVNELTLPIADVGSDHIVFRIALTESFLQFYSLIKRADEFAKQANYEAAQLVYEEAARAASSFFFTEGRDMATERAEDMRVQIILLKRAEAEALLAQGDERFESEQYEESILYFQSAMEIFRELDDWQGIATSVSKISYAEVIIAHLEALQASEDEQQEETQDDTQEDTLDDAQINNGNTQTETPSNTVPQVQHGPNYDHNRSISFDLSTPIDDQNQRPANQIRMGSSDGRNEGWYNGCGWVAAYNALILLGNPHHPADIVDAFETGGGTVFGGVFGTYPQAIERLFVDLGYDVNHTTFPQRTMNIDDAIRASRVSILAYMHTRAGHYITIEYRAEDGMFIVYNDNSAHARSTYLGFQNIAETGAVIDSVSALIQQTSNILFSFSLITIS